MLISALLIVRGGKRFSVSMTRWEKVARFHNKVQKNWMTNCPWPTQIFFTTDANFCTNFCYVSWGLKSLQNVLQMLKYQLCPRKQPNWRLRTIQENTKCISIIPAVIIVTLLLHQLVQVGSFVNLEPFTTATRITQTLWLRNSHHLTLIYLWRIRKTVMKSKIWRKLATALLLRRNRQVSCPLCKMLTVPQMKKPNDLCRYCTPISQKHYDVSMQQDVILLQSILCTQPKSLSFEKQQGCSECAPEIHFLYSIPH